MNQRFSLPPQFYVTAPQACPYLQGRTERKLFTALSGNQASELNDALSRQGFRRSQNVLYRPCCDSCSACLSARIPVADFTPSKSQKRVQKRNREMERRPASRWANERQYELFRRYVDSRHAGGGMADMDIFEFAAMMEESPVRTQIVEYWEPDETRNLELAAVALTDLLDDGLSMVYSFFDPAKADRSIGTALILDHIEIARAAGLPYVYLGYWVPGSPKMDYKARYQPLEVYLDGRWQQMPDREEIEKAHLDNVPGPTPITEQVANLSLPRSFRAAKP
ncbi:arginyltransferase [Paracoccaceae bacterium GXU_MW_L88]